MTLVCKSVGIWDGIVNPIYGCGVKIAPDINPIYSGKWFINPLENFFILWHILILPHFTPDQGQKMIFWWFELCSISLDMLERVKWPMLWNLSLISIIMRIREKNWHFKYWNWPHCNQNSQILAKKSISQYGYLKHSKWAVLRNLSLISIIMRIGEKKLGCHNTKKPQNRIRIWKIIAW